MLGLDRAEAIRVRRDEARAVGAAGDGREAGPSGAAAPQRGHATVHHHLRSVAGLVEEDGLEVAIAVETEPVENVAGEDDEA